MSTIATDKKFKYSEIFYSFQGEGKYVGMPTTWIRFFLCNLQCDGFGQKDPTDSSTYVLPYEDFDVSTVEKIEDMPVWEYGCDSSYTWAKKFRHLAHESTAKDICDELSNVIAHESNPRGLFRHPVTEQQNHLAFTGGEPMLNQPAMVAIMKEFYSRGNMPKFVTVETNGTKKLTDDLSQMITNYQSAGGEWFWSCSPKLWSTAGEKRKKAIKPEFLRWYAALNCPGQLKYVVDGSEAAWIEVEENTAAFREVGIDWPVTIMPVGATLEEQEEPIIAQIAVEAMKRGYFFSGRLHCYVFGNQIGT